MGWWKSQSALHLEKNQRLGNLASREVLYPTDGKGNSSCQLPLDGSHVSAQKLRYQKIEVPTHVSSMLGLCKEKPIPQNSPTRYSTSRLGTWILGWICECYFPGGELTNGSWFIIAPTAKIPTTTLGSSERPQLETLEHSSCWWFRNGNHPILVDPHSMLKGKPSYLYILHEVSFILFFFSLPTDNPSFPTNTHLEKDLDLKSDRNNHSPRSNLAQGMGKNFERNDEVSDGWVDFLLEVVFLWWKQMTPSEQKKISFWGGEVSPQKSLCISWN